MQEVRSGGSYISPSDTRLHFGLAKWREGGVIAVRWLGGGLNRAEKVRANQCVVIQQGKGVTVAAEYAMEVKI
jgi:phage-related tail fiber protein